MIDFDHITAIAPMPRSRSATLVRKAAPWGGFASQANGLECGRSFVQGGAR